MGRPAAARVPRAEGDTAWPRAELRAAGRGARGAEGSRGPAVRGQEHLAWHIVGPPEIQMMSMVTFISKGKNKHNQGQKLGQVGARPGVLWLSAHIPLWQPRVHGFGSRVQTWHHLARRAVGGIPHIK